MKAGRARKRRRIQEVLDNQKPEALSYADVARRLGVSRSLVCQTAHGYSNNFNVLKYFVELGVKPADLDLPPKFQKVLDEAGKRQTAAR